MKTVYVAMAFDFLHVGHINVIKQARVLGKVVVGLLTDESIASYKRVPLLNYEQRKTIIEHIAGVDQVIPQETLDYTSNLMRLRPDYVVHGDDWKIGFQREIRDRVIATLSEWGGELIEIPYTQGISSSEMQERFIEDGTTPQRRMKSFRRALEVKPVVRFMEVHNGLTGRIVEKTRIQEGHAISEYDGMWLSSLTDSVAKGKPDTGCVDFSSRLNTINEVFEVTTKPMIVDADNGGLTEHFVFMVKTLERLGVSAVIIEDKTGAKRNSLFGNEVDQAQDSIEAFSHKISAGKKARVTDDFMIIARIESLILKRGMDDALKRAMAYIDAGADAIMIHSKEKTPDEILTFCKEYNRFNRKVPLVAVPSSYNTITEEELAAAGVSIVIYANHMLRSAYPAMVKTAEKILTHHRSKEVDEHCMPIKEILTLIPGSK